MPLTPKAVDILLYLVRRPGSVVSKDELMDAIWPDTAVEENNLTQNISALRKALGERHRENKFIATVPGRGYKFVAEVTEARLDGDFEEPDDGGRVHLPLRKHFRSLALGLVGLLAIGTIAFLLYSRSPMSSDQQVRSLAVLPFKPITVDSRDEALEIGMADTLITKLSGGEDLTVRPLAAVRRFVSTDQDPVEAGRQLNVESVLDGGIQIAAGRVRVTTRLVRTVDGKQLWAGQFDEPLGDIFRVQDSISQRVASALRISLSNRAAKGYTQNVEAYELFLRGKFHVSRLVLPEVQKGIAYYDEAIALDPKYALAYAELSNAYRAMVLTNDAPPQEMMPRAEAAAAKAVEIDPELADAWGALANSDFWFKWDWEAAEQHFRRAIEIDEQNPNSHALYAHLLSNIGRHEQALAEIKRARELDPISIILGAIDGQIQCFAGREDDSLRTLRSTIDLDPNFWLANLFISRTYVQKGMWSEAAAAALRAKELTNGNSEATGVLGYIYGKTGDHGQARKVLEELEARRALKIVPEYAIAEVHLGLGDRQRALDHLEKAFEQRDTLMVFLKVEPKWAELRNEPRYARLLQMMKL